MAMATDFLEKDLEDIIYKNRREIHAMSEEIKENKPNTIFTPIEVKKPKYISLSQVVKDYLDKVNNIQDAEFEIIDNSNCVFDVRKIEDRLIELGALEDIEHEIVEPKLLTNKTKIK